MRPIAGWAARWLLATAVVVLVGATVAIALGLRINLTGSLPVGMYRATHLGDRPVARGDLVLACLPPGAARLARERGYVPRGLTCAGDLAPVGKVVVALAGDTVSLGDGGLTVNGIVIPESRPLARDSRGRPLPSPRVDSHTVAPNGVWLLAPSPRSFDSRYVGEMDVSDVVGRIAPLWTAEVSPR